MTDILDRGGFDRTRATALLAVAVALGASLQVMYHFIDVVGLPTVFLAVVGASLLAATGLARVLRPSVAVTVALVLLAAGLGWYVTQLTGSPRWLALLSDALSLLGGQSLLRISSIRAWVLGVTPAPVFLTWYFALRRWYTPALLVAGGTLGFFVLTGDADLVTTLTGVVAGAAALGLGDFDRRGEPVVETETVLVVISAMILVPALVPVVPASAATAGPLAPQFEGDGTLESNLLSAEEDVTVMGEITLSPKVRFTVTSDEPSKWRVASYGRYTGDGWVRTGESRPYDGDRLREPPGSTRLVNQTVRLQSESSVMPAAWKPVQVDGVDEVAVRSDGNPVPQGTLEAGESYRVESEVSTAGSRQLQQAGTDYPNHVEDTYTQLPQSTPDRVERRTDRLTAEADTPYETARVIERYLENSKNYSLSVPRPRGNVADEFLFERDAGYCTYFATTMAAMLRTQDVPARFVTGYTAGERVDEDEWVVRGLNAHAWVEVYFPDVGWVEFDPTPGGPREAANDRSVERARTANASNVDAAGSEADGEWTSTPTPTPAPLPTVGPDGNRVADTPTTATAEPPSGIITRDIEPLANVTATQTPTATGDDERVLPRRPSRQAVALGLFAVVGAVVGVRRTGVGERAYRALWVRYQPRSEPAADVERAFQRLLYHLDRTSYRSRRDHETVREYLDAVDASEEARRVAAIRERARYAGEATEDQADEAVRLVDDLVR